MPRVELGPLPWWSRFAGGGLSLISLTAVGGIVERWIKGENEPYVDQTVLHGIAVTGAVLAILVLVLGALFKDRR